MTAQLNQCYHGGEEAIAGVAAGEAEVVFRAQAEGFDDVLILLVFERAGGVDDAASGLHKAAGLVENIALAGGEEIGVAGLEAPLDFGVASEGSGAGTGGVNQDAVELPGEGKRLGRVEDDPMGGGGNILKTLEIAVAGEDVPTGCESLGGLVAGGGAEIEYRHPGLDGEEGDDGLRADVLLAAGFGIDIRLRFLKGGAGDLCRQARRRIVYPSGQASREGG